jgi:drug/metabolite transporter (DMT)-like permease
MTRGVVMNSSTQWIRLMMIAYVMNGLGPFGLKIMAEKGLLEQYHYQYLLWWYAGSGVFSFASVLAGGGRFLAREVVIALGIGAASFGGQLFSLLALESHLPGYIVFPVTTGGNLFVVAAGGVLLFKERIGPFGIAGIMIGILSLVLLSFG